MKQLWFTTTSTKVTNFETFEGDDVLVSGIVLFSLFAPKSEVEVDGEARFVNES
jgi:hypothetical protein